MQAVKIGFKLLHDVYVEIRSIVFIANCDRSDADQFESCQWECKYEEINIFMWNYLEHLIWWYF